MEQPGCLHANMDLYKWAYKLAPLLPGELVMDCFELSWRIRAMDMRASPYDLSGWGYPAIRIETPEGKAEYVDYQRAFAAESQELRRRLLRELAPLLQPTDLAPAPAGRSQARSQVPAAAPEPGRTAMTAPGDRHGRHDVDLTIRLTESPGAPEHTSGLRPATAPPPPRPPCRIPAPPSRPCSGTGSRSSSPCRARPRFAPSSTAARRLPS